MKIITFYERESEFLEWKDHFIVIENQLRILRPIFSNFFFLQKLS